MIVRATPEEAWNAIVAMDHVSGDRPLLLQIGLPVPQRCTLEEGRTGAARTCYFDSGAIEERVTTWEPPHRLELKIIRSTLPGRHWLGFDSASYLIEDIGAGQVRVTRTTTIISKLRPAAYWRPLERLGVEAEHQYLFAGLRNALRER